MGETNIDDKDETLEQTSGESKSVKHGLTTVELFNQIII